MERNWLEQLAEAQSDTEREAIMLAMNLSVLSPELRSAVETVAVPHWFNAQYLEASLGEDSDELYDQLLSLTFVEQIPSLGYAIHERTRRQILRTLWQDSNDRFRELSGWAADYCAEQALQTDVVDWKAEEIYHRLVSDPDAGVDGLRELATKWANYEYHMYEEIEHTVRLADEQIAAGRLSGPGADWTRLWQAKLALIYGRVDLAAAALEEISVSQDSDSAFTAEVEQTRGDVLAAVGDRMGMEAAWLSAYEWYRHLEQDSGRLDAFLVAERMRQNGLPDPEPAPERDQVAVKPPSKNALQLINNISDAWIEGVLKQSVGDTLELQMSRDDALASNLVFHQPTGFDRPVGSGRLSRLFAAANESMLILGAPGSGKTITLLQLLEELLKQARSDGEVPIPLLFNLSSFGKYAEENEPDLVGWLADQAYNQYRLKREIMREQVAESGSFTLLLDGLDEVPEGMRETCVDAINQFMRSSVIGLVVCSRIGDYQVLQNRLAVRHALVLQPLTDGQIAAVFEREPEPRRTVMKEQIQTDWKLKEVLRSPLLLSLYPRTALALSDGARRLVTQQADTVEGRRKAIFAAYIDEVFARPNATGSHPISLSARESMSRAKAESVRWLTYLAERMQQMGTTVFFAEELQPEWLPQKMVRGYRGLYGLVLGLIFGLIGGVLGSLFLGVYYGVILEWNWALIEAPIWGMVLGIASPVAGALATWITTNLKRASLRALVGAFISWLLFSIGFTQSIYLRIAETVALGFIGIHASIGYASYASRIQLRELVRVSMPRLPKLGLHILLGILVGLIGLLMTRQLFGPNVSLAFSLSIGLGIGIIPAFLEGWA